MKIHMLTLNWNGEDKLERLGKSISKYNPIYDANIYLYWHVRDNGSKDNSLEVASRYGGKVYPIGNNKDSFAAGMNYLFEKSKAEDDDLILLLNNDIEFRDKESLINMVDLLLSNENIGIVGARLLYTGTNKLQHAGVIFSERYNYLPYHYRHGEESDKESKKNREFQAVTAACSLIRAKDWRAVGGFNQGFWWAFEDIDFCLKVNKNLGKKIVYCGGTNIYHDESASLKKNPVNKMMLPQNVSLFKKTWEGKYDIDHNHYLKNKDYKVIK